jgi:hypothetical protein
MTNDDKLKFLYGREFKYQNKVFQCVDVKRTEEKFIVKTKQRSFVFYESEFELFYEDLNFDVNTKLPKSKVHQAVVIQEQPICVQVNAKLMDIFQLISETDNPEKELLQKANTMVQLSDAMVKNELLRLKIQNR